MIIGVCGKSGSGKSTLSKNIINEFGGIYLDIDKIGHKVLTIEEVKEELKKSFGENIVNSNKIDRKKLGELVFNSREQMKILSDITWKYMQIEIDSIIENNLDKVIILDWILLSKTKYFDMCDIKIFLNVPFSVRKERAILRDNITSEEFDLREKASVDFNTDDFDYVLENNSLEDLRRLVKLL